MLLEADRRQRGIAPSDSIKFFRPSDRVSGRIPLPAPHMCQTLGFREFRLSQSKYFVRLLTLGNVHRHAQHAFGGTVARVVERSPSCDPAYTPVWPQDAELRCIRLVALHGGVHGCRD